MVYFACPYRTRSFAPTTQHDTLGRRRPHRQESASRPSLQVGATFAPRRLPVALILAWRHARQLDDCHLESSAILIHPCPNVALAVTPAQPARSVQPAAGSLRARGNATHVCRSPEVYPGTEHAPPQASLAPMCKLLPQTPSRRPCSQQCGHSVEWDGDGAAVQS